VQHAVRRPARGAPPSTRSAVQHAVRRPARGAPPSTRCAAQREGVRRTSTRHRHAGRDAGGVIHGGSQHPETPRRPTSGPTTPRPSLGPGSRHPETPRRRTARRGNLPPAAQHSLCSFRQRRLAPTDNSSPTSPRLRKVFQRRRRRRAVVATHMLEGGVSGHRGRSHPRRGARRAGKALPARTFGRRVHALASNPADALAAARRRRIAPQCRPRM
jgi:hypothetical protein